MSILFSGLLEDRIVKSMYSNIKRVNSQKYFAIPGFNKNCLKFSQKEV